MINAARFHNDGFLVVPGVLDAAQMATLRARAEAIARDFDPGDDQPVFDPASAKHAQDRWFLESGDEIRCFYESEALDEQGRRRVPAEQAVNKIGHALHDLDQDFARISRSPKLAAIAQALGMRDPRLLQSMYIFKSPGIGGEVPWHQDATFLYTDPITVLGLWIALDDADRHNGCLWMVPGGHRQSLKQRFVRHGEGTRFITLDDAPLDARGAVLIEVEVGTLVAFPRKAPHRSDPNRSDRARHAYALHLIEADAFYPEDNWLRRRPERPLRGFATEADSEETQS
ncbi:MAG: phytanoyl-CoA dioxygenase family protein [Myxococcales bacterium]|nr:phytanoyl-CoA dioxygenase family protein [Myxococcales bacterium]